MWEVWCGIISVKLSLTWLYLILQAPAPDPEDMAASIKALARSVHGDGTEIFGDLPRRRLNTMELGKI